MTRFLFIIIVVSVAVLHCQWLRSLRRRSRVRTQLVAASLTGLAHEFSTTTSTWATTALTYAQHVFFLLVGIEIAWSAITYVLQKDSLPDFVAALVLKILGVGFFYIVIQPQYGPVWIADIIAELLRAKPRRHWVASRNLEAGDPSLRVRLWDRYWETRSCKA